MESKRVKLGPLDSAKRVGVENRWVYRQLKAGKMEANLAMKVSQILMNQKGMVESADTEARLAQIEERIADLVTKDSTNVVTFKKKSAFDL